MNAIQQARADLGLTQSELAERLGVNQATISRMESGLVAIDRRTMIALDTLKPRKAKS